MVGADLRRKLFKCNAVSVVCVLFVRTRPKGMGWVAQLASQKGVLEAAAPPTGPGGRRYCLVCGTLVCGDLSGTAQHLVR